eukprot:CAMPEP_0117854460 /NCGR_PEP_ID=MMETSP0950-20121206/29_1 /TAXON_ID=44440 /ORGANISM="Chattonella subsalsa, Strain CCMP2191" /LENGTH=186 /DNA_ID=CAMNT_0005703103 /DNA_START=75 /DNA_END=632 /DNA_ORIENTATION=+
MALRVSMIAAMLSGAAAFVPQTSFNGVAKSSTGMTMKIEGMVGDCAPLGFFDPLGYSKGGPDALAKYREQELKHGRVAMLAVLGWVTQEVFHPLYDGKLSANPLKAASEVPLAGWLQILGFTAFMELMGKLIAKQEGYVPGDLLGAAKLNSDDDEGWKDYQLKELNNGRAAMIAIMGMWAQAGVTG